MDALWSTEPSIVNANFSQARRMEAIGESCGIRSVSPVLGPFPLFLEDTFGMKVAMVMLERSLDPGRNDKNIQFSTARKMRSAYSNVYHASQEMTNVAVMAHKMNKTYSTMFGNDKGVLRKIGEYDDEFHERLFRAKLANPNLFEPSIQIAQVYSLRRSLRRGSTSEATNAGVSEAIIEINNRWRKFEQARGRRPGLKMIAHYNEISLALPSLWRYSRSF
jgi:hypothetical protein